MAKLTRERLLHDRAHLLRALRECREGQAAALPGAELIAFVDGIKRRLKDIETALRSSDRT